MSWIDFFLSSMDAVDGDLAKENRHLREQLESLQDRVAELEAQEARVNPLKGTEPDEEDDPPVEDEPEEEQHLLPAEPLPSIPSIDVAQERLHHPPIAASILAAAPPLKMVSSASSNRAPIQLDTNATWLLTVGSQKYGLKTGHSYVVGRDGAADIRVTSDWVGGHSVSRRHARLTVLKDLVVVDDLSSSNGTAILAEGNREIMSWAQIQVRSSSARPKVTPIVICFGKTVACLGHLGVGEIVVQGRTGQPQSGQRSSPHQGPKVRRSGTCAGCGESVMPGRKGRLPATCPSCGRRWAG